MTILLCFVFSYFYKDDSTFLNQNHMYTQYITGKAKPSSFILHSMSLVLHPHTSALLFLRRGRG